MVYRVKLIPEKEGGYSVAVSGLPGCYSQGETKDEALLNIREAIREYIAVRDEILSEEPGETTIVELEVA